MVDTDDSDDLISVNTRLPRALVERVEKAMAEELPPGIEVSRTAAIKWAIKRGLEANGRKGK
jgi:hypothetical protein